VKAGWYWRGHGRREFSVNPSMKSHGRSGASEEKGKITEIIAVTIGGAKCEETLRTALAFGADRAVHVKEEGEIQPLTAAQALAAVFKKEGANLFLLGKQAIDDDANQTGQMVAALLDLPQATFASKVELQDSKATVTREVDAGLETLEIDLPAVITARPAPERAALPQAADIMKAKKKPIEAVTLADLGLTAVAGLKATQDRPPPKRSKGVVVKTVDD